MALKVARRASLRQTLPVFCLGTLTACQGNQAPVAYDYEGSLDEDSPTSGLLLARDPEDAPLYYQLSSPPAHGEVVIDGTTGQFTYWPAPDFNGTDSFRFQVSDGRALSAPATVSLTIAPVNDAPVAIDPGTLQNSAYTLSTEIPLPLTDVDGDSLSVTVYSSDTQVATVSTDSHTLTITPTGAGTATIHVAASDGEYNAETDFAFNVGDVTKDVVITPAAGEPNVISLANSTPRAATFTLTYNRHQAFVSAETAAAYIRDDMAREFPGETFPRRLWRYVRDNTYHDLSLGIDNMWYDMWTTVNSLGWGLCGNVAAVYVEIARAAGYEARVWGLTGHVVPEIYVDGRWAMYDPDLAVYYYNHDGDVAGVEELAQDSTLITSPITPSCRRWRRRIQAPMPLSSRTSTQQLLIATSTSTISSARWNPAVQR